MIENTKRILRFRNKHWNIQQENELMWSLSINGIVLHDVEYDTGFVKAATFCIKKAVDSVAAKHRVKNENVYIRRHSKPAVLFHPRITLYDIISLNLDNFYDPIYKPKAHQGLVAKYITRSPIMLCIAIKKPSQHDFDNWELAKMDPSRRGFQIRQQRLREMEQEFMEEKRKIQEKLSQIQRENMEIQEKLTQREQKIQKLRQRSKENEIREKSDVNS